MLKKFDSKESDIDFANWACRIMLFKVKELNRARSRDKLRFSDDAIDLLASETPVMDRLEGKGLALERCLKQLNQASLSILLSRYRDGFDIPEIAEKTGRTIQAIYRSLSRSRQQLHECIIRTLSTSDGLY
jgi:RNA polymerase sigma-70 factor (ECF subfamily)